MQINFSPLPNEPLQQQRLLRRGAIERRFLADIARTRVPADIQATSTFKTAGVFLPSYLERRPRQMITLWFHTSIPTGRMPRSPGASIRRVVTITPLSMMARPSQSVPRRSRATRRIRFVGSQALPSQRRGSGPRSMRGNPRQQSAPGRSRVRRVEPGFPNTVVNPCVRSSS